MTALKQAGGKLLGRDVELLFTSTNAGPDSALRAAKKLVEQDKVSIIVGSLSGSVGIAIRDYSKTVPNVTVRQRSSGAGDNFCDAVTELLPLEPGWLAVDRRARHLHFQREKVQEGHG